MTASWNAWVNAQGGEGVTDVACAPVACPRCYADRLYYKSRNGAEEELQREQLLDSMRLLNRSRDREEECTKEWKEAAEISLIELYTFQDAVNLISQRYFDGCPVLFHDLAEYLSGVVESVEESLGRFNDIIANDTERRTRIDLDQLRHKAGKKAPREITRLLDMAKAEALNQMGESQAAIELAERHLS